ncbi:MAG: outer membrane beta-barrel protein [Betaproteobacteria bacterium]|nr:outer membrane beta-barrel protein [Betaproteobacteria bacterium]
MICKSIATVALAFLSASAFAGDVYILGSVGQASTKINKTDLDNSLVNAGVTGLSSSTKETDTAYKLQLGYQFNQYFAVEGGYVNLGEAKYSASFTGGNGKATAKVDGWNIDAVGILPLNDQFSLFGKLGTFAAHTKVDASASGPGGAASVSDSANNWSTHYGVGASYAFTKSVAVRVEYEKFDRVGKDNSTGKADVDLWSVGVAYKF